nr:nucleotidyltransferase family protein [Dechloromonas sp.]
MGEIVGILLAAGFGRRFGADKRLLEIDGMPLAVHSARKLQAACARSIVVLRPEDDALAAHPGLSGCTVVRCAESSHGMGHSLVAGVAASVDAAGWLIALADMPFVAPASYRVVVDALRDGAALAQPGYQGRPGHPVGFAAVWRDGLLALTGDSGARDLVRSAGAGRVLCPVDDPGIHQDIDLPVDLGVVPA